MRPWIAVMLLVFASGREVVAAPSATDGSPGEAAAGAGQGESESPVTVTARVTPDPSHIGDLLHLEVIAAYPAGITVNLPSGLNFGPLHLVSAEQGESEPTGVGFRKVFTITLQYFSLEPAEIPGFDLTYVTAEGEVHTVDVPARSFTVDSLLANEVDPKRRPEDPPVSLAYPNTLAETIVYSAFATLIGAALLAWVWFRWRRRPRPVVSAPPIPPHELALGALVELESSELLAHGRFQVYYLELTEIAKGYLEGRFGVEALDRTTDEIRASLLREAERIEPLSGPEMIAFLDRCDLVKFARFSPDPDEAEAALQRVREMVEVSRADRAPRPSETGPQPPQDATSGNEEAPIP